MLKKVHFIGIGGAGMAPLASMLLECNAIVTGSDSVSNNKTIYLSKKGATIYYNHCSNNVPIDTELVVYSSAIKEDNPELVIAKQLNIPCIRRGEFLAQFANNYKRKVAISGSHGKSSITAMLVWITKQANYNCGYLIGADFNDQTPSSSIGKNFDIFICEADESDATHTLLKNTIGIVPNFDFDHLWTVGGSEQLKKNFITFANNSNKLIYYNFDILQNLFNTHKDAIILSVPPNKDTFDIWYGFQATNARLAVTAAVQLGIDEKDAITLLRTFPGIGRRMVTKYSSNDLIIVEDYAHHPTEVASSIEFLRSKYPNYTLKILFQPHRFARLEEFFDGFANELKKADTTFITPVFAAWSETGKVNSNDLAKACNGIAVTGSWEEVAKEVMKDNPPKTVLAILGAGDINQVFNYLPKNK
jgi:UDP-N-acetylmuramate--alanine ligase